LIYSVTASLGSDVGSGGSLREAASFGSALVKKVVLSVTSHSQLSLTSLTAVTGAVTVGVESDGARNPRVVSMRSVHTHRRIGDGIVISHRNGKVGNKVILSFESRIDGPIIEDIGLGILVQIEESVDRGSTVEHGRIGHFGVLSIEVVVADRKVVGLNLSDIDRVDLTSLALTQRNVTIRQNGIDIDVLLGRGDYITIRGGDTGAVVTRSRSEGGQAAVAVMNSIWVHDVLIRSRGLVEILGISTIIISRSREVSSVKTRHTYLLYT
jgi:hypothetical protein